MMNIAVIGTGNVGRTLGARWANLGHQVVFGTRDSAREEVQKLVESTGKNSSAGSPQDAVAGAEVLVLAIPWAVTRQTIETLGDLKGKIVVDCTNPVAPGIKLAVGKSTSGGELVAAWTKGAHVVKAFNSTGWENMADPAYQGQPSLMLICGDDERAKVVVAGLAESLGFEAVDLGPLDAARLLEPFALVWIRLAMAQGLGRDIAFKLVRR
jgi:NADPH-dependent F420 reductase